MYIYILYIYVYMYTCIFANQAMIFSNNKYPRSGRDHFGTIPHLLGTVSDKSSTCCDNKSPNKKTLEYTQIQKSNTNIYRSIKGADIGPVWARPLLGPFICWALLGPGPVGPIHLLGPVWAIHLFGPCLANFNKY